MNQSLLTYETIIDELRGRIGNEWPPGTRLPPVKELARELGLGQSNTHRAIKALADEGLLICRPRIGTFVAEGPTGPLSGLRIVVLQANDEPNIDASANIVANELAEHGATVKRESRRSKAQQIVDTYADYDAIALINPAIDDEIRVRKGQLSVIVTTGLEYDPNIGEHYDVVSVDSEQGGVLAGDLAREIDAQSACFIGRASASGASTFDLTSEVRLRGFLRGWGGKPADCKLLTVDFYTLAEGAKAFGAFRNMDPRPELVFAASDDIAVGFVHGGLSHGEVPGRDYQLIGFDGQSAGETVEGGPLTSVKIPLSTMGHIAARMLRERFGNPQQPVRRVFLSSVMSRGATVGQLSVIG